MGFTARTGGTSDSCSAWNLPQLILQVEEQGGMQFTFLWSLKVMSGVLPYNGAYGFENDAHQVVAD